MRVLPGCLALTALLGGAPAQELDDETFASWRDYILPGGEELAWREIPWRASFSEGLADARTAGKPVLLWAMNGHPLGCT